MGSRSLYHLSLDGFPDGSFEVMSFEVHEAVSQPGSVLVTVLSAETGLDVDELTGCSGVLSLESDGGRDFRGVLTEFDEEPHDSSRSRCRFRLSDPLALLSGFSHCRVFQHRSVPEILTAVWRDAGLDPSEMRLELCREHQAQEFRVQYNESDLDFFRRTAASAGIFHFRSPEDGALVLADDSSCFRQGRQEEPMSWRPDAGLDDGSLDALLHLRRTGTAVSSGVRLCGYDADFSERPLRGEAGGGATCLSRYDSSLRSVSEASEQSRFRQEALEAGRLRIRATTRNPHLRPGELLDIAPSVSGFGGQYLILEVQHRGSQEGCATGSGEDLRYGNEILCQPCEVPYRDLPQPSPRISGVMIAKVETPDGASLQLDEEGRYRARLPFDEGPAGPALATPPLRMAQPSSGDGYGMHFPLHRDADLLLAFVDGDVDRPIALGAVPNPGRRSPVTAENFRENVLRTSSGNSLILDDAELMTKLVMKSAGGRALSLEDGDGRAGAELATVHGHRLHLSDACDVLELSAGHGRHALTVDDAKGVLQLRTASGHELRLSDEETTVSFRSASGRRLTLDDGAGRIVLSDGDGRQMLTLEDGKISVTTNGDLELAAQGSLRLRAGDIALESTEGDIAVTSAGDLKLTAAQRVKFRTGQELSLQAGTALRAEAGTDLSLRAGLTLESQAGTSNRMAGLTAVLEATGVSTVKGALVRIN